MKNLLIKCDIRLPFCVAVIAVTAAGGEARGFEVQSRREALVIGNQHYLIGSLTNPLNDAKDVATTLTSDGFTVKLVQDVSLAGLALAADQFVSQLRTGDVALLYYSGHGMQIGGENYLIPIDFSASDEVNARYTAFPVSQILEQMMAHKTSLNIVILDSCRNNPFKVSRGLTPGWASMNGGTGTYIAFATAPGSTADDDPQESNGLFTKYLLQGLSAPKLGIDELFQRVRQEVFQQSGGRQSPWSSSSVIGSFVFDQGHSESALKNGDVGAHEGIQSGGTAKRWAVNVAPKGMSQESVRSLHSVIDECSKRVVEDPKDTSAYFVRGETELKLRLLDASVRDLTKAMALGGPDIKAQRSRGRALLLAGQYSAAISDLSAVLGTRPEDYGALCYRSLAYAAIGQHELSQKDSSEAIVLRPRSANGYLARASDYLIQQRLKESVDASTRAIALNQNSPIGYAIRGNAELSLGDEDAARSDFKTAARLQLKSPEADQSRRMGIPTE